MMTVKILTDEDCEMLVIKSGSCTIFEGNYWDFNVPGDIIDLLDSLNISNTSESFVYELNEDFEDE